jgi:AraC-like DNA-binding protein
MKKLTADETSRLLLNSGIATSQAAAFATRSFSEPVSYDWHSHRRHQLIYAFEGTLSVEAAGRRHMLPPRRRAALIPAGLAHRTVHGFSKSRPKGHKRSRVTSVFLNPDVAPLRIPGIAVFAASPLLSEMLTRALDWGPGHEPTALSRSFFRTLALLCIEWVRSPVAFWLPGVEDPGIREAVRWVDSHLCQADEIAAAAVAGVSVRTFRRQFPEAAGMEWREYITRARLLRAAEHLASSSQSIAEIAWSVGYQSAPAFANAFYKFAGQTPGEYRRR